MRGCGVEGTVWTLVGPRHLGAVAALVALGCTGCGSTGAGNPDSGDDDVVFGGTTCSLAAIKNVVAKGGKLDLQCAADTTIKLDGTLESHQAVRLSNSGAGHVTLSGENKYSIFNVVQGSLAISGLTLSNGVGGGEIGGAVTVHGESTFLAVGCTFSNNRASGSYGGGAILSSAIVRLVDCTFTGNGSFLANNSGGSGGAISSFWLSDLAVERCTFYSNHADGSGGAIYVWSSEKDAYVTNSTFVNNSANWGGGIAVSDPNNDLITWTHVSHSTFVDSTLRASRLRGVLGVERSILSVSSERTDYVQDCGNLQDGGYNMVNTLSFPAVTQSTTKVRVTNLNLDTLKDNGGLTKTVALLHGSAAIDVIPRSDSGCRGMDQRMFPRPLLNGCDVGAFEAPAP